MSDAPWTPPPEAPALDEEWEAAKRSQVGIMIDRYWGSGLTASPAEGLARVVRRQTASALESYRSALRRHDEMIRDRAPQVVFYVQSEWERCITAAFRAVRAADCLRRQLGKWAPEDDLFRIDKTAAVHPEAVSDLRRFRDHIEHPEERQSQQACDLVPKENGLQFGDDFLVYEYLADVLKRLTALSSWLSRLSPEVGHPLNPVGQPVNRVDKEVQPFRYDLES